jgi:hypothetical protein
LFDSLAVGKKQAIISEEEASEMEAGGDSKEEPRLVRKESNKGNSKSKYDSKQLQL